MTKKQLTDYLAKLGLTENEYDSKMRLAKCVAQLGFHRVQEISHLSGSSLGQYTGLDFPRCIPVAKLQLTESHLCQNNTSSY